MTNVVETVKRRRSASNGKQVKLNLVHINFWSAIKVGFTIQIALAVATIVGFFILWLVASTTGLFSSLNSVLNAVVGGSAGSDVQAQLSLPRVMAFAVSLSAFNVVVGTLLMGVMAAIFNLIAKIVGGVGVAFTNNQ
jgi:uncharacterized membrane protein